VEVYSIRAAQPLCTTGFALSENQKILRNLSSGAFPLLTRYARLRDIL